jgi:transposase
MVDIALNAPDTVLLAGDEASLYLQASLMRVWAPVGQTPVIPVAANRDCTHFYGAQDLVSGKEVSMRSAIMTSEVSALFLNRILLAYPDKPIFLMWDRATWHRGAAVKAVLEANPRLEIMWFPPGCPELNPQEHVWKAAREAVSHNHMMAKLPELADAFEKHLTTTSFACSLLEKHGYHEICATFN